MKDYLRSGGDWTLNEVGQLVEVTELACADQSVADALSVPYDPVLDQGNKLLPTSPSDVVETPPSKTGVQTEIPQIIQRLQRAQAKEPFISPFEAIASITRLVVINDANKKTSVLYLVQTVTQQGDQSQVQGTAPPSGPGIIYSFPPSGSINLRTGGR